MSSVLEDLDFKTQEKPSDEDEVFAHYAESSEVTEGYIMGTPVIALCGKIFIPSKDPLKLRICPVCRQIADALFLNTE